MDSTAERKILELSGETYRRNVYLLGMHLRDATSTLHTLRSLSDFDRPDLLANATILFATAGLEGNLSYFSTLALAVSEAATEPIYKAHELEYLRAVQEQYLKVAELTPKQQTQSLSDRLRIVPKLLGRAFGREYQLIAGERGLERLRNAIERRDAIIHPSWDKYPAVTVADAIDAVFGVLEYIDSVRQQLFPYMIGYAVMLDTYGPLVADLAQEQPPPLQFRTLSEPRELTDALARDWTDAHIIFDVANSHETEGDSDGSMLTRAALVALYSMVNSHLSITGKLAQLLNEHAFSEKDVNFFNEQDYDWDEFGNAVLQGTKQYFEDRATIVPMLISKRICPHPLAFDNRGGTWFQKMFKKYLNMRNGVMHSKFGETAPRVSKAELWEAFESVRQYCAYVATAGGILGFYSSLLRNSQLRNLSPESFE